MTQGSVNRRRTDNIIMINSKRKKHKQWSTKNLTNIHGWTHVHWKCNQFGRSTSDRWKVKFSNPHRRSCWWRLRICVLVSSNSCHFRLMLFTLLFMGNYKDTIIYINHEVQYFRNIFRIFYKNLKYVNKGKLNIFCLSCVDPFGFLALKEWHEFELTRTQILNLHQQLLQFTNLVLVWSRDVYMHVSTF
jgi:hypothetical protein